MELIEKYGPFDKRVLAIFEEMKKTPQSEIHHKEGSVWIHTNMVLSEVEKIKENFSEEAQNRLIQTAIFHDIAKPKTTIWEEEDWRSPGHAKLGEFMFRELMWNSFSIEDREKISKLIRFHGLPIFLEEKEDPDMSLIKASLGCNINELINFAQCDFRGRICQDLDSCLFKIELFKERAENLGCLNNPYQFSSDWARLHFFKNGGYAGKEIWEPDGAWVTIMCGLPGSGKNTWIERNYTGPIIELDAIRKAKKIKWDDKDGQGVVMQAAKEELRVNMRKKQDVLWNGTNMTAQQRAKIIDLALEYRSKIRIVYIDCSIEKALAQNKAREEDKRVKDEVIEKYARKMEIPNLTECHELVIVK